MQAVIKLKGTSVNLCAVRDDDEAIGKYVRWMNDDTFSHWLCRRNKVITHAQERQYIATQRNAENPMFNICTKNGTLIGMTDLKIDPFSGHATLGCFIGDEQSRNKGYGTEALKLLCDFAFKQCRVHAIYLRVVSEKVRAIRCYTKVGFVKCGTQHGFTYYDGHYHDMDIMEYLNPYEN